MCSCQRFNITKHDYVIWNSWLIDHACSCVFLGRRASMPKINPHVWYE